VFDEHSRVAGGVGAGNDLTWATSLMLAKLRSADLRFLPASGGNLRTKPEVESCRSRRGEARSIGAIRAVLPVGIQLIFKSTGVQRDSLNR
jgi:hypothetical protein